MKTIKLEEVQNKIRTILTDMETNSVYSQYLKLQEQIQADDKFQKLLKAQKLLQLELLNCEKIGHKNLINKKQLELKQSDIEIQANENYQELQQLIYQIKQERKLLEMKLLEIKGEINDDRV